MRFTVADYNAHVLRLVTIPNLLLSWCYHYRMASGGVAGTDSGGGGGGGDGGGGTEAAAAAATAAAAGKTITGGRQQQQGQLPPEKTETAKAAAAAMGGTVTAEAVKDMVKDAAGGMTAGTAGWDDESDLAVTPQLAAAFVADLRRRRIVVDAVSGAWGEEFARLLCGGDDDDACDSGSAGDGDGGGAGDGDCDGGVVNSSRHADGVGSGGGGGASSSSSSYSLPNARVSERQDISTPPTTSSDTQLHRQHRHSDAPGAPPRPPPPHHLLVLASETIYSPHSLGPFAQVLCAVLQRGLLQQHPQLQHQHVDDDDIERQQHDQHQQYRPQQQQQQQRGRPRALVAAKKVYFGVGGGADAFVEEMARRAGDTAAAAMPVPVDVRIRVRDVGNEGVARVVVECEAVPR